MVVLGATSAFMIRQKQQEGFVAEELTKVLLSGLKLADCGFAVPLCLTPAHLPIETALLVVSLEQHTKSPLQQYMCPGHTHEAAVQCCAVIGPHIRG
jgi:hypothetical protein